MGDFDCCANPAPPVCPECKAGKACAGFAFDEHDDMVPCTGKDTD